MRMTAPSALFNHDAEMGLLGCCLVDADSPDSTIGKARAAGITAACFDDPRNARIWTAINRLQDESPPVADWSLAEDLTGRGELDQAGGVPHITELTAAAPTSLRATHYINVVIDCARRRELDRLSAELREGIANGSFDVDEAIGEVRAGLDALAAGPAARRDHLMQWDDLLHFDPANDPDCLLGKRYLGRGDGGVIVAPSGVGKSVLSVGLAASVALGRPFFGVVCVRPLRVVYAQAEDALGDVAEAVQGFVREHQLTSAEIETVRKNLRIVRWNDAAGEVFLRRLRAEHGRHPFDLAIINPLFSYCGCNVSEQSEMSAFLRNGLNPILTDTRAAAIIVHHTNKPPTDGRDRPDSNTDLRYAGSGSSELTNWARAFIALQPVKGAPEGVTRMVFAKRGTRAGIVDNNGRVITSVVIEHSKRGLCWVPSDYQIAKDTAGKFKAKFDLARATQVFNPDLDWPANEQAIALDQDVSRKTVGRWRQTILDTVP